MNLLYGSIKNLPGNIDLRNLNSYLDNTKFMTNIGFRCLNPSKLMNYPSNDIGFLIVSRKDKIMQLTYITVKATYVSGYINNNDGSRLNINWIQQIDGRHKSSLSYIPDILGMVTDTDIQTIIREYILPFDDAELWAGISDKITKERAAQFSSTVNPNLDRRNGTTFEATKGFWVKGNNIIAGSINSGTGTTPMKGSMSGLILSRSSYVSGDIGMIFARGKTRIYNIDFEGEVIVKSSRVAVLKCRNRPILSTLGEISADKNREVALRSDVRWKIFYNGRDNFKDMAYPAHAREVLVQLYTDIGGRIHRNNAGIYWRDPMYCEFEPMHFIRGIYNVINQDSGFCYHHGDATIHIRHIGAGHIINARAYRTASKYEGDAGPGVFGAFDNFPSIRRVWWR